MTEAAGGAPAASEDEGGRPEPQGLMTPMPPASLPPCPYLASIDLDDRVGQARPTPDTANRCLSTGEPVAPSARDQRRLCLTADHPACARFAAATVRSREPEAGRARDRRLSGPILAAVAVLILAAALAGISLAANGDLSVGVGDASPTSAASASASASAPAAIPAITQAPTARPTATPAPSAAVAAATSALKTPPPTAVPTPPPTPRPRRFPGLTPCPDAPDCYIYVVKSGDALGAIAARYGFTLDDVLARNPSIGDPGFILRGQEIRLPTPRR